MEACWLNHVEVYSCGIFGGNVIGSLDYSLEDAVGDYRDASWWKQQLNSVSRILEFDYTGAGFYPEFKMSVN